MGAFARQYRPAAAFPSAVVGAAVSLLSIAIVIIAPPTRALRQIAFEHLINHGDGINYQRVIRGAYAQPDKMKKIAANYVTGGMCAAAVGQDNFSFIRI